VDGRLFLVAEPNGIESVHAAPSSPHVGIWWHRSHRLVGFAQTIDDLKEFVGLVDSDLGHNDLRTEARPEFGCGELTEYFDVPRGRGLWSPSTERGLIYHGNGTDTETLNQIAAMFGLRRWDVRHDDHYFVGENLKRFLDDE
jgi:hypothetical protein